jgi:hypothetical protein
MGVTRPLLPGTPAGARRTPLPRCSPLERGGGWRASDGLAVLQLVPWTDVIKNARPRKAKKLCKVCAKRRPSRPRGITTTRSLPGDIQTPLCNPAYRSEQDLADLHAQMLESAALIQTWLNKTRSAGAAR